MAHPRCPSGDAVIRHLPALLLAAASVTGAAAQMTSGDPAPASMTCPQCGVVRSVKRVETAAPITAQDRESTAGFVASVPLGGGKPKMGSSTGMRSEQKPPEVRYEVVVRLDDGRYQLVVQDDPGGLHEGDKVRIDRGKVVPIGK
jgi:hypothetical protein